MATRIQIRRDTAANWTSVNPILGDGEIGYEKVTGKFKVGDGTAAWTSLTYFSSSSSNRKTADLSVVADNIEINFDSLPDFVSSNRVAISANATVSFANATAAQFTTFKAAITNLATITFPINSISGDNRIVLGVFTPTENGNYSFSIYLTENDYEIVISQNPAI